MSKSSCGIHKISANFTTFIHEMQLSASDFNFQLTLAQATMHRGYSTDFRIEHAVFACLSYIVRISKIANVQ